jgi:hypothetical protein
MFATLPKRISFAVTSLSRRQYLHRKADQFLAKALPDILELTEKALSSIMMGHPKVVKITLYPQCNDREYINILIERLQNCGLKVEINGKGPHFYKTLEVSF